MGSDVLVVVGVGGMGVAIAQRLGSGRRVLLADVHEVALESAVERLQDQGHQVTGAVVDVCDADSMNDLARTAGELGRVTHVAHTAGLSPTQATTSAILAVDLLGVALSLEAFATVIAPGGAGVVISSMAGHLAPALPAEQVKALVSTPTAELLTLPFLDPAVVGDPGQAYVIAKQANHLQVQEAAAAWGERGARINSISPGIISTPMGQAELAGETGEQMRMMLELSAAKRLGTPDDIASAAAYLLDPQCSFITGTDLLVDGGTVAALRRLMAG